MFYDKIFKAIDQLQAEKTPFAFYSYCSKHDGRTFYCTVGGLAHVAGISDATLMDAMRNPDVFHILRVFMEEEYGITVKEMRFLERIHDTKFSNWQEVRTFFERKQKYNP